jgi:hypothetical protein
MLDFYALSLLSGFFEIAPFASALQDKGVLAALVVALCYQMGNLAPCPLKLSGRAIKAVVFIGSFLLAAYFKTGLFPLLCVATALLSTAIQSARSSAKQNASKPVKRLLRIAGFALGLLGMPLTLLIAGATAVVVVWIGKLDTGRSSITVPRFNAINYAMVLHQTHYFSYCYAAIAFAATLTNMAIALGLFLAGWAVYILAPRLYNGYKLTHSFYAGHSFLVLVLLSMFFVPSMALKAILWILTGLGGTTEFCLARLSLERGGTPDGGTFAENAGHILGVALSIVVYIITNDLSPTIVVSAAAALGAVIMAVVALHSRKEGVTNYACEHR